MSDFINMLVEGVMDAVEEFFSSLTAPSSKFTFNAFVYSLMFLAGSVLFEMFEIPSFVSWQEALTCSVLMSVIVCIDTSVRGNIKSGLSRVKALAANLSYSGEEAELNVDDVEVDENESDGE